MVASKHRNKSQQQNPSKIAKFILRDYDNHPRKNLNLYFYENYTNENNKKEHPTKNGYYVTWNML
jgi:hypothetical protein